MGAWTLFIFTSKSSHKIDARATLQENGNFVLHEKDPNGSVEGVLWPSFDYPSYILLPGMKLGFNEKTERNWNLKSWTGLNTPILGSFTPGMDPNNTQQLVLWWQRNVYWTSGPFNCGSFGNMKVTYGRYSYNFVYVEDEYETYFSYSMESGDNIYIGLDPLGRINGQVSVSCNSDNPAFFSGCVPQKPPTCRNRNTYVSMSDVKYGNMSEEGYQSEEFVKLSLYDCGARCLNNCSCVAYSSTTDDNTRCQMWTGGTKFIASPIYFIQEEPNGNHSI